MSRGKSYEKRVLSLCSTPDGGLVATVSGTETYVTHVDRTETGGLSCSCTCPYERGACKHGVAVVLAAFDALKRKRAIPVAGSEDNRFPIRSKAAGDASSDEENEEDGGWVPEYDVLFDGPPKSDVREQSKADRVIRAHVSKMANRDLKELLLELVESVSEARDWIADRIRLDAGDATGVAKIVREVRLAGGGCLRET